MTRSDYRLLEEFRRWRDAILPRIESISDRARELYSSEGRLPHYDQVAADLLDLSDDDRAVPRAGFLHGLGGMLVSERLGDLGDDSLRNDIVTILRDRDSLAALGESTPDLRWLESDFLPTRDSRGAVLFVIEQVRHVDPHGALGRWVRQFRSSPAQLPGDAELQPRYLSPRHADDRARYANFITAVVAPTARFFGLWHEKDVLEDAALLLASPDDFRALVDFVAELARRDDGCMALRRAVEQALAEMAGFGPVTVNWEWRRAASMHRRLPHELWQRSAASPMRVADADARRFGWVTVICENDDACYLALRRLHQAGEPRDSSFRDYIARPLATEYGAALHTEVALMVAGPTAESEPSMRQVPIRLVPKNAVEARLTASRRALSRKRRKPSDATGDITVYTPDGRAVVLPRGGTVLNFAYRLHNELPAFVRGAQVNRQTVDPLSRLEHGDVVWLDLTKEPRPLPQGWERAVAPGTVGHIREKYRVAMRRAHAAVGRLRLGEYLVAHGIGSVPDDAALDALVDSVDDLLARRGTQSAPKGREWWYVDLGRSEETLAEDVSASKVAQRLPQLDDFMERVAQQAALVSAVERLQDDPQAAIDTRTRICAVCRPKLADPCVVSIVTDTAFLHAAEAPCVTEPSYRIERLYPEPQYVVVLGPDRTGLVAEVCEVFRRNAVAIEDLVAVRLPEGRGLIRVRTRPTPPAKLDAVVTEIRNDSQLGVCGPGDKAPYDESRHLTPRVKAGPPRPREQVRPYIVGSPVSEERHFYGMDSVLSFLQQQLELIANPANIDGRHVFIHGPKKVGKTSAVRRFLQRIAHTHASSVFGVYVSAEGDEPWSRYELRLRAALLKAATARAAEAQVRLDIGATERLPLPALLAWIRDQLKCSIVLAIDEAMKLMRSSASDEETRALLAFATPARHVAQLLTIWIGPTSNTRRTAAMHEILQASVHESTPALKESDVGPLLRAEKMGQQIRIYVDDTVVAKIYNLTLGNPFWIGNLAMELWKHAKENSLGQLVYDDVALQTAQTHVANLRRVFSDRYQQPKTADDQHKLITGSILVCLATANTNGSGVERGEIRNAVATELGHPPDEALLSEVLDDLFDRGTIQPVRRTAWKISAPLLTDHIVRVSGGAHSWLLHS